LAWWFLHKKVEMNRMGRKALMWCFWRFMNALAT